MTPPSLSIVVPAFDEADSIPLLVGEIDALRDRLGTSMETIVVDDGSVDDTPTRLDELRARHEWLRTVRHQANRGQTAALATGIETAQGALIATLDADLQNDPADLPRLVDVLQSTGADMVTGIRVNRRDSLWKRLQSRVGNAIRNWVTGDHVRDSGCTLRVAKREVLTGLLDFDGAHRFVPTLARIRGAVVVEEPVNHRARRFGETKYRAGNRALNGLVHCFEVRRRRRRARG